MGDDKYSYNCRGRNETDRERRVRLAKQRAQWLASISRSQRRR